MAGNALQEQGTRKVWATSGGDAVLTLTSLANSAGRAGDAEDLGDGSGRFAVFYRWQLKTKWAVAPTAGNRLRLAFGFSDDNTDWPGSVTGSDAAYSDLDLFRQLVEVRSCPADNTTNAQAFSGIVRALGRYCVPAVYNESGQALSGTAGDHELSLVPLVDYLP